MFWTRAVPLLLTQVTRELASFSLAVCKVLLKNKVCYHKRVLYGRKPNSYTA